MINLSTPEAQIAQNFMRRKGYGDIHPTDVEKVENLDCWYFTYQLPEGTLELEVLWNDRTQKWETTITLFTLTD